MAGFRILCVGKIKESYFNEGIEYYQKQIRRFVPIDIIEVIDEPTPEKASAAQENEIKNIEGKRILSKIKEDDYMIALCIDGKHFDSSTWQSRMRGRMDQVSGNIVFIIGGSLGLSDEVIRKADEKLSFSSMTFPHQMMRMILCEQIASVFVS